MSVNRPRRRNASFAAITSLSPLSRECPECQAAIGQRCWAKAPNGGVFQYPRYMKTVHKARRNPKLGRKEQES